MTRVNDHDRFNEITPFHRVLPAAHAASLQSQHIWLSHESLLLPRSRTIIVIKQARYKKATQGVRPCLYPSGAWKIIAIYLKPNCETPRDYCGDSHQKFVKIPHASSVYDQEAIVIPIRQPQPKNGWSVLSSLVDLMFTSRLYVVKYAFLIFSLFDHEWRMRVS
ncbi:hypothetical protein WG66_002781 [Moniliophthora roreri]|nr:hypothetical protein WG66_002781 [Moniliophthora roreri]